MNKTSAQSPSLTAHRPELGILLKVVAIGLFTIMSGMIKEAVQSVPTGEAVFFRSFAALPVILIWLALRGDLPRGLRTKQPLMHVWRGLVGTTAMGLNFLGLGMLPLPEATALSYVTPIFTLILAALMLGERIRLIRISAVAVGLLGVLIMLSPRLGASLQDTAFIGALCILGASAARGFVQIHLRKMVQVEETAAIVFYFSLTASALALLTAPFGWVMPSPFVLGLLVGAGLIGGVAQILVTSSYRFAPASLLAPYDYASMLFAIVIGYIWFAELPTLVMLAGAALVIAANAIVIWRERRLGVVRGKAKRLMDPKGG
ncbi:carboxylate/amino acid/amine transporter [Tritonibacter multivorans]|uniref:Carboxylate/amino acid/amine transporter n=1 Tax=Tritonibacter multivorans TaxID=928856 RepID=A0A0P1GDM6_9RHOB|nr:DMT family transporter [Tritonibacter multivorans]MDA7419967.1 DMT family transporter [Tritonibacter multivorans]CUH79419.1 carboxylate/amino acid/amine transporter [Tritonibacter multivorans]SFC10008.1 Permease of the drug/metabolite transporter (DMT) superfamily [Tritonibacter multivorans]